MEDNRAVARRNHRIMLAFGLMLAAVTAMALPASAFGAGSLMQSGSYASCAQDTSGGAADWTNCLPSGRWGRSVGVIMTRQEPAEGLLARFQNMGSSISTTMRLMMPNMMLTICQVMWSAALGMSQFAASFTPVDAMGQSVDHAAGRLAGQVMAGSLPAWLLVVGLCGGLWVMVFRSQQQGRTILRRCLVSALCLAAMLVMGGAASRSSAAGPASGSPWWVVKNVNDTVNTMAVGLDLDGLNDDPSMMSYSGGGDGNCQRYLYEMGRQYAGADGGPGAPGSQSNVVTAIDRLWQETALRSYVTMQWGNPKAGGPSNPHVADNAQQAYCHVLEAAAGTPVGIQKDLSNRTMGTGINDRTARYLFDTRGWITTTDTSVNTSDKAKDSDETTKLDRMGVFWETCTADQGQVHSRGGWNKLVNNLSDSGSGAIEGAGKDNTLRIALGGKGGDNWDKIAPSDDSRIMVAGQDYSAATTTLCSNVFGNKIWNNYEGAAPKEPTGGDNDKNYADTNLGDSAAMGWRFDVPNVGATWREANMYNEDPNTVNGAVPATLNYLYGTSSVDTIGAIGSAIGSLVNLIVWGLFAFILILAKTMLTLMALLIIPALLAQSFPIGENIRHSVKRWFTFTINLSAMSILYGILATIATFICQTILKAIAPGAGTFFYQILAGVSPLLSLFIISLFCTKVLHVGNPFSPQAMLKIASTGALGNGIARLASRQARMSMYRRAVSFGRKQGHRMGLGTRSRMGTGTTSSRIAEQASRQQYGTLPPGTDQAAQTVATGMPVPPGAPGTSTPGTPGAPTAGTPGPDTPNGPAGNPPRSPAPGGWLPTGVPAVPLRTHAGNIAKGAIKLGAAGAGAAALGGEALALPAAITMAGIVAGHGIRQGLAYHEAADRIAAWTGGPGRTPLPEGQPGDRPDGAQTPQGGMPRSGGLDSGRTADQAALEQDGRVAMGTHPATDPIDVDPTPVPGSRFDAPKPQARPLAHEPKPVWDDSDPKGSKQAWAAWNAHERETDALLRDEAQRERRGIK